MLVSYLKSQYILHCGPTLVVLNDLEVKTADIENAYLTASVSKKIWCVLGPEFGADTGKPAIVVATVIIWPKECWCIILESPSRLHAAPTMGVMYR
jgi:hypothetical protein